MTSLPTDEELHSPVVNGGDCTAFIKTMNLGSARPIFDMLQKSVDFLFRRSWKKRLPKDYWDILLRASFPLEFKSEEEFFSILYEGIFIDGEGKWFSLDKETRTKRYVISARKLGIAWSDDERYYHWKTLAESERYKFPEAAELLEVCWLDITGSIDSRDLSPGTNYGAYLILKFVDDNFGLDVQPAQISVKVGGTVKSGTAYLRPNKEKQLMNKRLEFLYHMQLLLTNPSHESVPQQETEDEEILLGICFGVQKTGYGKETEDEIVVEDNGGERERLEVAANDRADDDWMEIELGTFSIDGDEGTVEINLKENGGHWKGGLIIQGIEVRPLVSPKIKEERPVHEVSTVSPTQ